MLGATPQKGGELPGALRCQGGRGSVAAVAGRLGTEGCGGRDASPGSLACCSCCRGSGVKGRTCDGEGGGCWRQKEESNSGNMGAATSHDPTPAGLTVLETDAPARCRIDVGKGNE